MTEATMFEPITGREPLTDAQVQMLINTCGSAAAAVAVGAHRIETKYGTGKISQYTKCVWTDEKRRITFSLLPQGGMMAIESNEPDPECREYQPE